MGASHHANADERLYHYRARVVRVIDGDSCILDIDTGFGIWLRGERCRLAGIDAPETWRNPEPGGKEATAWLEAELAKSDGDVIVQTEESDDKYGRWLVWIYTRTHPLLSLNRVMVDRGLAVPYGLNDGRG